MRPAFRTMFVALLAVVALSAIASASASAATCKKEAGIKKYELCLGASQEFKEGTFPLQSVSRDEYGTYLFKWSGVTLSCKNLTTTTEAKMTALKGSISISPVALHFTECESGLSSCAVENGAITMNNLVFETIGKEKVLIYPKTGTTFGTLNFVNKGGKVCGLGKGLVIKTASGKEKEGPICSEPQIELAKTEHTIECTGAAGDNNLKLGEEEMTFKGSFLLGSLREGETLKSWAIVEGS